MQTPRIPLARLPGLMLAAVLALAPTARAGVNTWTGGGPARDYDASSGLIASDPRDPYVVYAVFQPSVYKSWDGGRTWALLASFVHIDSLLVHPAAPDTLYMGVTAGLQAELGGVVKSSDGGMTWGFQYLEPNAHWWPVSALAGSPADPGVVYAGASSTFFKTTNGGATWTRGPFLDAMIASLVVSPRDQQDLYIGLESDYYYFPFGDFLRSGDGGLTFQRGSVGVVDSVAAIAVDPNAESRIYVGLSGDPAHVETGIRRSEDAGTTFISVEPGLPAGESVLSLVLDPADPSTVYAGTYSGVYRSRNYGTTWSAIGQLVSGEAITSLAISDDGRRVHASTFRGAFHMDLVSGPVDIAATPDGGAHVLRWNSDRLAVQTVDGSNRWTAAPFSAASQTWTGMAIASGGDGPARVLWQNGDGRSALETVGAASTVFGRTYGIPADVAAGSDGSVRLLWTDPDGGMYITTRDSNGSERHGPPYGPTSGWNAVAIDVDAQGRTWVLWRSADGRAAVSVHVDGTLVHTVKWGATQGWWVEDIGLGADGRARVLARNVAGAMQIWTVGEDGSRNVGATHESPGLVPRRIAGGADGLTRVLWGGDHGEGAVWFLTNSGNHVSVEVPVLP